MSIKFPAWASDAAVVGLIFAVGSYVARLEYGISELHESVTELDKKIIAFDTAISIHHGNDWTEKVENKTLSKVGDLEGRIGEINSSFNNRFQRINEDFSSNINSLSELQDRTRAISLWTAQADVLVRRNRLEQFRALALYSTREVEISSNVYINKQHRKGRNFKKGDNIVLVNPLPPGLQVDVTVAGFLDDPNNQEILVQLNTSILSDLNLNPEDGKYELFIQPKPEALRWKSLEDIYKEVRVAVK